MTMEEQQQDQQQTTRNIDKQPLNNNQKANN